ncbi:Hypothetical predicted protein [Mytilus galloprovincialis]|uniref:Uncharacterized protein n=1 Tax=Mytilus galloprovincialis TaxID=29158 RepID=A0A8B6E638_MYTGA|nr:Hypothetical predicted protein [Mytilus galloprovincialis]
MRRIYLRSAKVALKSQEVHYLKEGKYRGKKTIKPREITQTSNEEEVAQDTDILSEDISDLVSINSVVAVKTDDDNFDYYLMKISKGSHVLNSAESDSWGATYPPGFEVFRGHYYDKISDNDPLKYKLLKDKDCFGTDEISANTYLLM